MTSPVFRPRHPPGLFVLFFTEMWERFGFYSMLAMFTLYLKDPKQGFGWHGEDATRLYSNYLMFVYLSPLVGGWIADKKLGYRNSVLIGGVIFMGGYFLLSVHSETVVYLALTCLVIANGFFKPNVSAMVGHLYPEGSHLKDRAYNIFYMGINIGALLAPINAEFMVKYIGYNMAFAVAGVGMIVSIAILWGFRQYVEVPWQPSTPLPKEKPVDDTAVTTDRAAVTADLPPPEKPKNPIDAVPDSTRVGALIVIFLIVIVFWMVFHQNGSTLTYWADDHTNWKVSGIISNAINPFWVVTLTFPVVWFWRWLDSKGMEPSIPTKMTIAMFLTAVAFSVLYFAAWTGEYEMQPDMYVKADYKITERSLANLKNAGVPEDVLGQLRINDENGKYRILGRKFATDGESTGEQKLDKALAEIIGGDLTAKYLPEIRKEAYLFKVSPLWLLLAYAILTLAELLLSPMGLSLVSKVAPVRMRGLMMGGWFVATAIGNKLTMIGVFWDYWLHSTFWAVLAGLAAAMGVVQLLLLRPLKKAMPGV
jgi:POT family proton-dependent oligopeptide transporter